MRSLSITNIRNYHKNIIFCERREKCKKCDGKKENKEKLITKQKIYQ